MTDELATFPPMTFDELRSMTFGEMTDEQRGLYMESLLGDVMIKLPPDIQGLAVVMVTEHKENGSLSGASGFAGHLCGITRLRANGEQDTFNGDVSAISEALGEALLDYGEGLRDDESC